MGGGISHLHVRQKVDVAVLGALHVVPVVRVAEHAALPAAAQVLVGAATAGACLEQCTVAALRVLAVQLQQRATACFKRREGEGDEGRVERATFKSSWII